MPEQEMRRRARGHAGGKLVFFLLALCLALPPAALLWMPALEITGNDMRPTLCDGDYVMVWPGQSCSAGDVVAFRCSNRLLVKRVIALAGDEVDIDREGLVYVNGVLLDEPDLPLHALGPCNIELPCVVPEGHAFVLGDERMNAVDSRNTSVGCVPLEGVVGRAVFCVWPLSAFGPVR